MEGQIHSVSGYKRDRPALERLLQGAREGKFDVVVFPAIDRVGRSVKDVIEIDGFLRKHDIDTVFLREGVDTSTATGQLFRNIMASLAEFEGTFIRAQHDAIVSDVLFGKCQRQI